MRRTWDALVCSAAAVTTQIDHTGSLAVPSALSTACKLLAAAAPGTAGDPNSHCMHHRLDGILQSYSHMQRAWMANAA